MHVVDCRCSSTHSSPRCWTKAALHWYLYNRRLGGPHRRSGLLPLPVQFLGCPASITVTVLTELSGSSANARPTLSGFIVLFTFNWLEPSGSIKLWEFLYWRRNSGHISKGSVCLVGFLVSS